MGTGIALTLQDSMKSTDLLTARLGYHQCPWLEYLSLLAAWGRQVASHKNLCRANCWLWHLLRWQHRLRHSDHRIRRHLLSGRLRRDDHRLWHLLRWQHRLRHSDHRVWRHLLCGWLRRDDHRLRYLLRREHWLRHSDHRVWRHLLSGRLRRYHILWSILVDRVYGHYRIYRLRRVRR